MIYLFVIQGAVEGPGEFAEGLGIGVRSVFRKIYIPLLKTEKKN